jgi:hypothetical protein
MHNNMKLNLRIRSSLVIVERDERKAKISGRVKSPLSPAKMRQLDQAWNFGGKRTPSFMDFECGTSTKTHETLTQTKKEDLGQTIEQTTPIQTSTVEDTDEVYFHDDDFSNFGMYGHGF